MGLRGLTTAAAAILAIGVVSLAVSFGQGENSLRAVPVAAAAAVEAPPAAGVAERDVPALPESVPSQASRVRAEWAEPLADPARVHPLPLSLTAPPALPAAPLAAAVKLPVAPPKPVPTTQVARVDVAAGTLLTKPLVGGRSSSRFGMRFHPTLQRWKLHTGHDWAAPCGTPVGAAAAGVVTRVGWAGGNGMQIRIDHGMLAGKRVITTYNHLGAVGVKVNQQVRVGDGIGKVGNNGNSTGCHLHLEVIANGQFTDPLPWLNGDSTAITAVDAVLDHVIKNPETTPLPSPPASTSQSPSPSPSASASPSVSESSSPEPSPSPSPATSQPPSSSESPSPSDSPTPSDSATQPPASTDPATPTPTETLPDSPSPDPEPTSSDPTPEPSTPDPTTPDPAPTSEAPPPATASDSSAPEPTAPAS